MRIAVIGAGNVGGSLGRRWAERGHDVRFGVRQPSEKGEVGIAEAVRGVDVVVLATAAGVGNDYQHVVEEVLMSNSRQGGEGEARVRADLAFFEGPNGGGVFSTGSIGWCSCLGVDGYDNPVARVTGNAANTAPLR